MRLVAELVGFTVTGTPFHPSASQPYQKPVGGVVPSLTAFRNWHAAKFTTLNDQLVIDGSGFWTPTGPWNSRLRKPSWTSAQKCAGSP